MHGSYICLCLGGALVVMLVMMCWGVINKIPPQEQERWDGSEGRVGTCYDFFQQSWVQIPVREGFYFKEKNNCESQIGFLLRLPCWKTLIRYALVIWVVYFIMKDPRDGLLYDHPLVRLMSEEKTSQWNKNKRAKGALNASSNHMYCLLQFSKNGQ